MSKSTPQSQPHQQTTPQPQELGLKVNPSGTWPVWGLLLPNQHQPFIMLNIKVGGVFRPEKFLLDIGNLRTIIKKAKSKTDGELDGEDMEIAMIHTKYMPVFISSAVACSTLGVDFLLSNNVHAIIDYEQHRFSLVPELSRIQQHQQLQQ